MMPFSRYLKRPQKKYTLKVDSISNQLGIAKKIVRRRISIYRKVENLCSEW